MMGRKQPQLLWIYSLERYLKSGTEFGCVMPVANKGDVSLQDQILTFLAQFVF